MPFDPAPQVGPAKVSEFQHLADAMLRGAAITPLAIGIRWDGKGTCALGAMHLGLGIPFELLGTRPLSEEEHEMHYTYAKHYGEWLHIESNKRLFTREQIAARIAAL